VSVAITILGEDKNEINLCDRGVVVFIDWKVGLVLIILMRYSLVVFGYTNLNKPFI
jgi:hypothetical protein